VEGSIGRPSLEPRPVDCWICAAAVDPYVELAPLPLVRCVSCGFVFRPDLVDATQELYEVGAYQAREFASGYVADETLGERVRTAQTRLVWLRDHVSGERLLDVGAAGGAFVLAAKRAGFDAWGIEPTPGFARYARETLGLDVRDGRIEEIALDPASLDVVTLWHVLEHVPEPLSKLEQLRTALRPHGHLVVEVPNMASVMARTMGTEWTHLDPDVHASHFTPRTLRHLLERAGFHVRYAETIGHSTYLTPRERLAPRHFAHRLRLAIHGAWRTAHPDRHEFLRVVASRSR
jgi:2-polyprenyl-3-methyl-5-hydroxy-6-metoxy-1,4-benzoquinol methylase